MSASCLASSQKSELVVSSQWAVGTGLGRSQWSEVSGQYSAALPLGKTAYCFLLLAVCCLLLMQKSGNSPRRSRLKFSRPVQGKLLTNLTSAPGLEDELHCQLHVAAFDVAVRRDAFDGADETAGNVLRTRCDVKIRMVKRIEEFTREIAGCIFRST